MRRLPFVTVCVVTFVFVCIHQAIRADDNNGVKVNFNQSVYFINEKDVSVMLTVVVTKLLPSTNITVHINVCNGSSIGKSSSDDCAEESSLDHIIVEIPINHTSKACDFDISQTSPCLPTFSIAKVLFNDTESNSIVDIGDTNNAIVEYYIKLQSKQPLYSFNESSGLAIITLVLDKGSSHYFIVKIKSSGITAHDEDYDPGPYDVIFFAGNSSANLTIPLSSDNIVEGTEEFDLEVLTLPDGIILSQSAALKLCTVKIIDTTIAVNFNQSLYSFEEGTVAKFVITINKKPLIDFTVEVKVTDVSTIAGQDNNITSLTVPVHFPANATNATFSISLNDDNILENNENFTLEIIPSSGSSLPNNLTIGVNHTATVIIKDIDSASVYFKNSTCSFNENKGTIQLTLVLSISSSFDITVHLYDANGSSATPGEDYKPKYEVTFQYGTTKAKLNITIINDPLLEPDEKFTLTINSSSLPSNVTAGSPSNATVTILNDDSISVYFENLTCSINETGGSIQLTPVLSNLSSFDITVQLHIAKGSSATPGEDYEPKYEVTFPNGTTKAKLNITIINDSLLEPDEKFTLAINSSSLPSNVTAGSPDNATVTILNDDYNALSFKQPKYTGTIGDTIKVELVLDRPLNSQSGKLDVNVTYLSDEGSSEGLYPVIFVNQSESQTISINVTQNGIVFILDENHAIPDYIKIGDNTTIIAMPNKATNIAKDPTSDTNPSTTDDTTGDTTGTSSAPTTSTFATTTDKSSGGFSFTSSLFVSIILLLFLAPVAYVSYQNREKISGFLSGRKGARRGGRVKYQLLPSSIGEALRSSHRD